MVFAKFLLRRGTTSEWTTSNPILSLGEPGYDTTTGTLKVGDGITQWSALIPINNLEQAPDLSGPVTALQGDVSNLETAVGNLQSSTSTIIGDLDAAEGSISTLQGQVSSLSSTTSTLSSNLSSLDTSFDAYVLDMEKRIRYEYI